MYKDQIAGLSEQLVELKVEKAALQVKVETANQALLKHKSDYLVKEAEIASLRAQKAAVARKSALKRGKGGGGNYRKVKPTRYERELASSSNSFSNNSITNSTPNNTNRASPPSVAPTFTCNVPSSPSTGPVRQIQHFVTNRVSNNNRVHNNFYSADTTQSGKSFKLRKTTVPDVVNSRPSFETNVSEWASTSVRTD